MIKGFKSEDLAELVNGECTKNGILITNFSTLKDAVPNSISFYNDNKFKQDLIDTKAGIVILKKNVSENFKGEAIFVDDPYLAYAKISTLINKKIHIPFVHKNSIVYEGTTIHKSVTLHAFCVVGSNCNIGKNTIIEGNSFVGNNVIIGENVIIHSNVTIESGVSIGNNCEIFSGARIGSDGFGYAKDRNKSWVKIPQIGSVVIGNNVDIGSNSTIDRGAIDNTIICDGVKIDNQVQIGHNCIIGENTIIAGCAGIAGSTKIGKNCMIGGATMIKGHLVIADDTIISGGTGIGKNIEESGKRFTNVFPYNIEHKDWLRIANNLKKIGKKND
jgi:UDP-3-O-[3-hydroxymyristoyl] glucosamine N-acyltransferase